MAKIDRTKLRFPDENIDVDVLVPDNNGNGYSPTELVISVSEVMQEENQTSREAIDDSKRIIREAAQRDGITPTEAAVRPLITVVTVQIKWAAMSLAAEALAVSDGCDA